ncbi:MAG TPA: adenylate/guanylate cyclase domain-containing protein, partial [Candidatus Nitrosotenuis sp.]|nr:adenylate/guanylate cyclase domain-containing protein [Candidatus Nitrosotenuis sp.]
MSTPSAASGASRRPGPARADSGRRAWFLWLALLGLAAAVLGAVPTMRTVPFVRHLELVSYDLRLGMSLPRAPSDKIHLVTIDSASLEQLGRWPWKRTLHAELIRGLSRAGARVIAFDVSFAGTSGEGREAEDQALIQAVRDSGRVVLARGFTVVQGRPAPDQLLPGLAEALCGQDRRCADEGGWRAFLGDPRLFRDGNVVREAPAERYQLDLPLWMAIMTRYQAWPEAGGNPLEVPYQRDLFRVNLGWPLLEPVGMRRLVISFPGRPFASTSYAQVLAALRGGRHQELREKFSGTIVLVHSTIDEHDIYRVPRNAQGRPGLMPGGEVQACVLDTVLGGHFLRRPSAPARWGTGCALAGVTVALLGWFGFRRGLALGLLALILYLALAVYVFLYHSLWLDVATPLLMAGLVMLGAPFFENQRVRQVFSQFLPAPVLREVLESPAALERREERVVTVMFVDLRGYTALSEKRSPQEMTALINRFHAALGEVYQRHGGYVASYQGDAQMVLFGAPRPDPDHAAAALRAALEIEQAMAALNADLARDYPDLARERGGRILECGVGIN